MTTLPPVAAALEELRLAESRLERRRDLANSPSSTERSALRYVFDRADAGELATPSEIAEHIGMSRAGITLMLTRLINQRLVALRPNPGDRRSKQVIPLSRNDHLDGDDALTDSIRAAALALTEHESEIITDFLEHLREMIDRSGPTVDATVDDENLLVS